MVLLAASATRGIMVLLAASAIRGLRAPPARMQTNEPTIVVGLDGVLIDSEPATTRCAWLTAQSLWPEIMDAVTEVSARQAGVRKAWVGYDWSALTGVEEATGMPSWLGAKLRQLRPVVRDGGYEAVLLARLCAEEALASSKGDRGARPLSVGEIELGWQEGLRDVLMARYGVTKQELAAVSEAEEEAWRCADATGWLAANGFFPGALEALRRCDAEARCRLLLLSRRPSRQAQHSPGPHAHPSPEPHPSANPHPNPDHIPNPAPNPAQARELLEHAEVPGLRLLEPEEWEGSTKADALAALRRARPEAELRFVDDSARTLLTCASDPRLLPVALHFASYGYSSASQAARIGAVPRMRTLTRSQELDAVFSCAERAE